MRNSHIKLSHSFQKIITAKKRLFLYCTCYLEKNSKILKQNKKLNTFRHKMKHYYLNDLSNTNLLNIAKFDYVSAITNNIFLFIKEIFLSLFFSGFTLTNHNENKAISLLCSTSIIININIFRFLLHFYSLVV